MPCTLYAALQYPHCVRKAIPVTDDMVHNTLDEVKAVQTPPLSVHDGDWLLELDLFTLRNIVLLLLPLASGRRLGGYLKHVCRGYLC